MSPFFSILIPAYNTGNKIDRCLQSIFNQSYQDYEIVIVNDGSRDDTEDVIYKHIKKHPNVKIVFHTQENAGAGAARNKAMSLSSGLYTAFIDSDDYWDSDFLQKTYDVIQTDQSDLVFIDIIRETELGKFIRYERMSTFSNMSKDRMIRAQLTGNMPWGGVRKIIKTSIIKEHNLQYAPIKVGEESIFSFQALYNAKIISFQKDSYYHYVDSVNSLTSVDTLENSSNVHDYIYDSLKELGLYDEYRDTLRSLSITTIGIALNVINNTNSDDNKYNIANTIIGKYKPYLDGPLDYKSLDRRILILVPFIKMGLVSPIFFASKIQKYIKHLL